MSTTGVSITPAVEAVLRRGVVTDGTYRLPPEQLERKLYEAVAKTLKALGGKWNRKAQGFPVSGDFEVALTAALDAGVAVDKDREAGFFPTPPELAAKVWELLGYHPGDWVLEPSCAGGDLLAPLLETSSLEVRRNRVFGVETDKLRAAVCAARYPGIRVINQDFLAQAKDWLRQGFRFQCVAMNPPFVKGSEYDHILAAIELLDVGGRLVSVAPAGISFRESTKAVELRARIEECGGYITDLPEGSFKSVATGVSTCLVVIP